MNVYFTSDLHLQHRGILGFGSRKFNTLDEHDEAVIESVACLPSRSVVYCMGDWCFAREPSHPVIKEWCARTNHISQIHFVYGNHDELESEDYLQIFDSIEGFFKYKQFWISHCPIHPAELWGRVNIHGHVHHRNDNHSDLQPKGDEDGWFYQKGDKYVNVNWDFWRRPLSLDEIREMVL